MDAEIICGKCWKRVPCGPKFGFGKFKCSTGQVWTQLFSFFKRGAFSFCWTNKNEIFVLDEGMCVSGLMRDDDGLQDGLHLLPHMTLMNYSAPILALPESIFLASFFNF